MCPKSKQRLAANPVEWPIDHFWAMQLALNICMIQQRFVLIFNQSYSYQLVDSGHSHSPEGISPGLFLMNLHCHSYYRLVIEKQASNFLWLHLITDRPLCHGSWYVILILPERGSTLRTFNSSGGIWLDLQQIQNSSTARWITRSLLPRIHHICHLGELSSPSRGWRWGIKQELP